MQCEEEDEFAIFFYPKNVKIKIVANYDHEFTFL
jgi:hypothetical protein